MKKYLLGIINIRWCRAVPEIIQRALIKSHRLKVHKVDFNSHSREVNSRLLEMAETSPSIKQPDFEDSL